MSDPLADAMGYGPLEHGRLKDAMSLDDTNLARQVIGLREGQPLYALAAALLKNGNGGRVVLSAICAALRDAEKQLAAQEEREKHKRFAGLYQARERLWDRLLSMGVDMRRNRVYPWACLTAVLSQSELEQLVREARDEAGAQTSTR